MRAHGPFSRLQGLVVITLGLLGCGEGPLEVNGSPSQTFSLRAGRELEVTLRTVGPGQYASPPLVSTEVVRFLDMQFVNPVPAGPTQRFRFEAVRAGVAIIVFHHTAEAPTIEDTVIVH